MLFDKISLLLYERERSDDKRMIEQQKRKFIKNNTVVVKVNDKVIYDSMVDGEMTDELYMALVSYGLVNNPKSGKKKNKVEYTLNPSITSIIPEDYV